MAELQPDNKITKDEEGVVVCTECGDPLFPIFDGNELIGFRKCDHSGGEKEYSYNGATHHA